MRNRADGQASGKGATTAQLRNDINSGRTGDKVAGFDPAAAPLGTDEEAAGTVLKPELIAEVREQERAGRPTGARSNAATPELQPDGQVATLGWMRGLLLGVGAAALLGLLLLWIV